MDTNKQTCPQCGTELPANIPAEQCPKCLLQVGMGTQPLGGEASPTAPPKAPPPPSVAELAKHFPQLEILELLGQGGMGVVYKARQPQLDRLVALKILPADTHREPSFADRFAREARALARLNHPNVVGVYDFGETRGIYYLLMEFVDGVNLRQLERSGELKPRQALQIVPAICDALQYAHDQGIVHRDIKPENILLDKNGRVKIADFGLAKMLGLNPREQALTQPEQVMGTVSYMAPEQRERPAEVDHRADIYSLGVVFYEMLTGELPLGKFAPPSSRARGVQLDVRLDEVVLRALEKEPERRYQTAGAVKTDVETISRTNAPAPPAAPAAPRSNPWQQARQAVRAPAMGLIATGILNWALISILIPVLFYIAAGRQSEISHPQLTLIGLAAMVFSSFMIYAGVKMKELESRPAALAGSFLAMIMTPGNLIGLPVGIWSLATLFRPQVKKAFEEKAAHNETDLGFADVDQPPLAANAARNWFFAAGAVFIAGLGLVILLVMGGLIVSLAWPALQQAAFATQTREIKSFTTSDPAVAKNLIVTNGAWLVASTDRELARLFEVPVKDLDPGRIVYQAQLKAENLTGQAYLEMWCRFPGRGEFFSRGLAQPVSGTTDWVSSETPFVLRKGESPDLIRLNLVVEGTGQVLIREVKLTHWTR